MIFSIIAITLSLGLAIFFLVLLLRKKKYLISFLETGIPGKLSYRESIKTRNRYFPCKSGEVLDLSEFPDLQRFRELTRDKEYLVEPWNRVGLPLIEEGKTKVVVYGFIQDDLGNDIAAIPCLRLVETFVTLDNDNPLQGYKEHMLGVKYDNGRELVSLDSLLGIVLYESV